MALRPNPRGNVMRMPGAFQRTEVTLPSEALCHYITDDELERIGEMRKEPVQEICLAAVGVFFGSLLPAFAEISRFNSTTNPMGWVGLITCFLAFGSLTVMGVTGFLWKQRAGSHGGMLETIRGRTRVPVQAE